MRTLNDTILQYMKRGIQFGVATMVVTAVNPWMRKRVTHFLEKINAMNTSDESMKGRFKEMKAMLYTPLDWS